MPLHLAIDDSSTVTVELDIFSGRPNPTWVLSRPDKDRLSGLLAARDAPAVAPKVVDGLGYRGLVLKVLSGSREKVIHVGHGRIQVGQYDYLDRNRGLEKFLMNAMPNELLAQFGSFLPTLP
jgi:hypothetical protein